MTWRLADVARVCKASWHAADAAVTGFSTDSRTLQPGQVFVAIRGEHFDGHRFVADARARGAVAAVVDHEIPGESCLIVSDTLRAYADIAAEHLDRLRPGIAVVGVTGSSGKTSTKDLMASVFSQACVTVAPQGSLNNEIGLPATVLSADEHTEVLVLEMGMRGLGHIEYLCSVAAPDVSVVLNVGSAHIGELGSRDAIARAKSEIVRFARSGATAVLNADDARVAAMANEAKGPVVWFGHGDTATVRASAVRLNDAGHASFMLELPSVQAHEVHLQVVGAHQVDNACAAAGAAYALGLDAADIVRGLQAATARSQWRMERSVRADGLVVINDAYNANPESMAAAISLLSATAPRGRTIAVLGEMRELGAQSQQAHEQLGALTRTSHIDFVIAVGAAGKWIAAGRGPEGTILAESIEEAVAQALTMCSAQDVVLCKASRGVALERVGIALLEQFGTVSP